MDRLAVVRLPVLVDVQMLQITNHVGIPDSEIELLAVRAQGPGGQNVNKVSTAVHLRFDVAASSLPEGYKYRLLQLRDNRLNRQGVIVIKAQGSRSQETNRADALARLQALIRGAMVQVKRRVDTKPTRASQRRRVDSKVRRGRTKSLRQRVDDHH